MPDCLIPVGECGWLMKDGLLLGSRQNNPCSHSIGEFWKSFSLLCGGQIAAERRLPKRAFTSLVVTVLIGFSLWRGVTKVKRDDERNRN